MINPKLQASNIKQVQKFKYLIIKICLGFAIFNFGFARPTHAQVSLIVSPPHYDETVNPGSTLQKTVKITNNSTSPLTLQANVYDFIVEDDAGTPVIVKEEVSGRYLASPWFTLDRTRLTVAPHTTEQVYAVITVPTDALPGGHYAGVYFSPVETKTPSQTSGAGVTPQIGSLFSLTVEGDLQYSAIIKDFSAIKNVYEFGPVDFTGTVENQSDTHLSPVASVTIKDMLGRTVTTLAADQVNIFPFKSRTIQLRWDQIWGLGKYGATLSVPYGDGQVAERTIHFWLMPWRLLAAVAVVLLVLLALIISIRRHLKHRHDQRDTEISELKRKIAELENKR